MAALDADWLDLCRRASAEIKVVLEGMPPAERAEEVSRGGGGDMTVRVDAEAEAAVFRQLDRMHEEGVAFTAVSEERGFVPYGDESIRVVIDPVDGSLNAKRGFPHHAVSIAVADGPAVGDVAFGYVYDFGAGEEWWAKRGEGAWLDGVAIDGGRGERRTRDGKLELICVESADPRWIAKSIDGLLETTHRIRAMGAIAVSLCQVAAGRADAMLSLKACRSFDAAAGVLIVRESGGYVAFPKCEPPLGNPLDLEPHSPVVAARSEDALRALSGIPS